MRRPKGRVHFDKKKRQWYARFEFTDPEVGRTRFLNRLARSRSEAKDMVNGFRREWEQSQGRTLVHDRKTMADLASMFEKNYVGPAEYADGRKVRGYRSLQSVKTRLKVVREYFG